MVTIKTIKNVFEPIVVAFVAIVFGLIFGYQFILHLWDIDTFHDWDQHFLYQWVPYISVVKYHQFPLWNPYMCGGTPMLGNPQSRFLSPFFLISLLWGPFAGLHIEGVLHLAIAWAGAYGMARTVDRSPLAAACAGVVFASSSWFFLRLMEGHSTALPWAYLPWVAMFFYKACKGGTHALLNAALSGLVLALMFGEGGVYPAPQAVLVMGFLAIGLGLQQKTLTPFKSLLISGLFGIVFALPKLIAVFNLLSKVPRLIDSNDSTAPHDLIQFFLSRNQDIASSGPFWGFHEYGAYIGILGAALVICGGVFYTRRSFLWIVGLLVFLLLGMGTIPVLGRFSPWVLLHQLPVYSSMQVPSRFFIVCVFFASLLASYGVDYVLTRPIKKSVAKTIVVLILLTLTVNNWLVITSFFRLASTSIPHVAPSGEFRQFWDDSDHNMMLAASGNRGSINCYEPVHLPTHAVAFNSKGYRGEVYFQGPQGHVRTVQWSPNELIYDIETDRPSKLIINQNYDGNWKIVGGSGQTTAVNGLLAVDVPVLKQRITVRYVDAMVYWSFLAPLVGLILIGWLLFRRNR